MDYIKYPYEKPWVRQADVYTQPEGDMDHFTNYKKDYTGMVLCSVGKIEHLLRRKLFELSVGPRSIL